MEPPPQKTSSDLTPQEWEDFIRQHGSAMLRPDGEGETLEAKTVSGWRATRALG